MMDLITSVDHAAFNRFLYSWAALGIFCSLAIHFTRLLPISSRIDNKPLNFLGQIDKKLGWVIMETPILIAILFFYLTGKEPIGLEIFFVLLFVFHYTNRALIYPYRIKVKGKKMALSMVLVTMLFYTVNGYLLGYYFGNFADYGRDWFFDPRFIVGLLLFIFGFVVNVQSDNILLRLRKPGENAYKIPYGGFFRFVSCPNYFGEIVEWIGFALMTWCLPALIYAIWVCLALFFTALGTHRWYRDHFAGDYPGERRAVLPYLL